MNGLREKFRNKKGFTLIEMLIVVAIIAILIAVSIPLVNSALERAREATDAANERSFKAELLLSYTLGEFEVATGGTNPFDASKTYTYDANNGCLSATNVYAANKGYGKSTAAMGVDNTVRKGQVLYGKMDTTNNQLTMWWGDAAGTSGDVSSTAPATSNLISPLMVGSI